MRGYILALRILCVLLSAWPAIARSENRAIAYEAQYQLVGYFLRAANICNAEKAHIDAIMSLLDHDELKAFSKGFPQMTEKWMMRGAELFNASVMSGGIPSACNSASESLRKATAH